MSQRCLPAYPSVYPSFCLSFRPSVRPSVCSSVRPSVRPSVCLTFRMPFCLSVCLSAFLSVCLSFRQSEQSLRSFKRKLSAPYCIPSKKTPPQPLICLYLKRKTTQDSNPAWLTVSQRTSSKNYFTQSLLLPILVLPSRKRSAF